MGQKWDTDGAMNEPEYRSRVQEVYDRIQRAFENVDPDIAECEQAMGVLTITLADRSRCILSTQPSVRQVWFAFAAKGTAAHFNFDPASGVWIDDKSKGLELVSHFKALMKDATGLELAI
jgi:iron donor protein CyaY